MSLICPIIEQRLMGSCQGRVVTCVIPNGAGIKQEGSQNGCYALTEKTPSKMDVAPWDKHWIKRE